MRILMLRQKGMVLPAIHDSMSRAFASLGAEAVHLTFPQTPAEWKNLKGSARGKSSAVFTLDLPLDPSVRIHIREYQASIGIPWVIWFVDDPEGYDFPSSCGPARTLVFCWDLKISREISLSSAWKGLPLIHLPLAADPEVFFPEKTDSSPVFPGGVFAGSLARPNPILEKAAETGADFPRDLSRLWAEWKGKWGVSAQDLAWRYLEEKTGKDGGTLRGLPLARLWVHAAAMGLAIRKRKEVVCRTIGRGGAVFGDPEWKEITGELYRGRIGYGEPLRQAYNRSLFVLDVPPAQARTGLTQRVYDAGACARPVLTQFSGESGSLFDPGEEIYSYRTLEEAEELSKRIVAVPGEAKERARRARNRVLAHHTYRNRAATVLACLQRDFPLCAA